MDMRWKRLSKVIWVRARSVDFYVVAYFLVLMKVCKALVIGL